MSKTIPPPPISNPGNIGSPNIVDTIPNDNTNNTGTNNVALNANTKDLPQLLDSRGCYHVINVPTFDVDNFSTHEGPYNKRDTKIDTLRLKLNAFKALEGEKDEESLSSEDEGVTTVEPFMTNAEDESSVGKVDARFGQWVRITIKTVQRLHSMSNGDERKHILEYTNVDLHYVEDKRKNLLNKFNSLKQEFSLCKSELIDLKNTKSYNTSFQNEIIRLNLDNESLKDKVSELKRVIEKWTSSKVTLDQFLTKQVPGNIVRALGGKDRKTLSPSRHWTRFPSFSESARTAALSPFRNVRAVAHEFKFEWPFEVPHALFDRERGGQLPSVLAPAAAPLEPPLVLEPAGSE
nr:hypothetical protein [Tanacetum cinerariifolium]